jgi:cytochrome P450
MSEAAALSPAVPKPDHVAERFVYDFDQFRDPAYLDNPHARIREMIGQAPPVFWTPRNGGHWMIIGHEAVFKASRDWDSFTSEMVPLAQIEAMTAAMPAGSPHIPLPLPICIDPPAHTKFRAPLNATFSPKAILALKDDIRALAAELVAGIKGKGRCEFMSEVAEPMPVQVFLKMFGLPVARQVEYRAIVKAHLSNPHADAGESMKRLRDICDVMHDTLIERRDNPRNDVISLLWQTEIDGRPTTLDDMENYCVLLFIAGLDTVMNGIGLGVRHLAANPDLQAELRANPKLIPEAAEELLRRYTFTVPPRLVARDIEFEGARMVKGERAMLFLPAADLDPGEFPDPQAFDLKRENKVHIAFGTGPHRCLGSHLARVELQVLYEELLAGLPEFRLDPAYPIRFHGGHVVGPDTLHLLWEA